jgi:pimeloyl-ACP methyl ester carboxylesterase
VSGEFSVIVPGGALVGRESGRGLPVLILHGGPLSDYTAPLVDVLPDGLSAIRYQQRGLPPSTETGPFDISAHVEDAVAVLDHLGLETAWLLGHSWGGHLAFHIAVSRPQRVAGVIAVDPLGAVADGGWAALDANIFSRLEQRSPADARRAKELDERTTAGVATDAEAAESLELVWPYYFADPSTAPPMPEVRVSVPMFTGVMESVYEHFERKTLEHGLASYRGPFALIHGEHDPLPPSASELTAKLVEGARVEVIPACGHFPWLERPTEFRAAIARALARADIFVAAG